MLTVTIVLCGWCRSPRPLEVIGVDQIPPGAHVAKVNVSHGICIPCGTKFSDMIEKGSETKVDTLNGHNATEENR